MSKGCDFCARYDFRQVTINFSGADPSIAFVSALQPLIDGHERFMYCPKCGAELTAENFDRLDFKVKTNGM